jgi:hypothetical protein
MLKVMFVLTVFSHHATTAPVIISQHSTSEACEKAFQSFQVQAARNTIVGGGYPTTAVRTHACTETEVWAAARE